MRDRDINRKNMFKASLAVLRAPEHKPLWIDQKPPAMAAAVDAVEEAIANLDSVCQQYDAVKSGTTKAKYRAEVALEQIAFKVGKWFGIWLRRKNDEVTAAQVDFAASEWRRLREQLLLDRAILVRDKLDAVLAANPETTPPLRGEAALAANTPASVGLTRDLAKLFAEKIDAYSALISGPRVATSDKKARGGSLRSRLNEVEELLVELDSLVLHFDDTDAGLQMINAYNQARLIVEAGHGPSPDVPPPPTPPAPSPPKS